METRWIPSIDIPAVLERMARVTREVDTVGVLQNDDDDRPSLNKVVRFMSSEVTLRLRGSIDDCLTRKELSFPFSTTLRLFFFSSTYLSKLSNLEEWNYVCTFIFAAISVRWIYSHRLYTYVRRVFLFFSQTKMRDYGFERALKYTCSPDTRNVY